ncbi:MAG: histidine phosphatase family protein [Saprospiraceae bacterium]|nr:histidine phosphatase family protein [Saprospiraceae bacterium]
MKRIYFIRHAKSSWDNPQLSDHDRPLNKRGIKDAPRVAKYLHDNGENIDFILSSTAQRARSTAEAFKREYDLPDKAFMTDGNLYHAPPDRLIAALGVVPDEYEGIAVFAHNPGMTELAGRLAPYRIDNVPTCGVTITELSSDLEDCQLSDFNFIDLVTPKGIS